MSLIAIESSTEPAAPAARPEGTASAEALRYFVASLAALAVDSGLLWVGAAVIDLPVWLAGAIAYAGGLVLVYLLSIRWVFRHRVVGDARGEFVAFAALGIGGLLLNSATLLVATRCGLALPLAKLLSAGLGFAANFVSRKVLLFAGPKS